MSNEAALKARAGKTIDPNTPEARFVNDRRNVNELNVSQFITNDCMLNRKTMPVPDGLDPRDVCLALADKAAADEYRLTGTATFGIQGAYSEINKLKGGSNLDLAKSRAIRLAVQDAIVRNPNHTPADSSGKANPLQAKTPDGMTINIPSFLAYYDGVAAATSSIMTETLNRLDTLPTMAEIRGLNNDQLRDIGRRCVVNDRNTSVGECSAAGAERTIRNFSNAKARSAASK
jgi:hypothetical protein